MPLFCLVASPPPLLIFTVDVLIDIPQTQNIRRAAIDTMEL